MNISLEVEATWSSILGVALLNTSTVVPLSPREEGSRTAATFDKLQARDLDFGLLMTVLANFYNEKL